MRSPGRAGEGWLGALGRGGTAGTEVESSLPSTSPHPFILSESTLSTNGKLHLPATSHATADHHSGSQGVPLFSDSFLAAQAANLIASPTTLILGMDESDWRSYKSAERTAQFEVSLSFPAGVRHAACPS